MKLGLVGVMMTLVACGANAETTPDENVSESAVASVRAPAECHATGDALTNWPELSTPYNGHVFVFMCTAGQPEGECRYLTTYPNGDVAYGCQRVGDETPKK